MTFASIVEMLTWIYNYRPYKTKLKTDKIVNLLLALRIHDVKFFSEREKFPEIA